MVMKRRAGTEEPLELLETGEELAPAAARDDDEAGRIDEVAALVEDAVESDLAVGRNDVEAVDDGAAQARALAHGRVVHDDRVLDHGALVDPHRAAQDGVADGGP